MYADMLCCVVAEASDTHIEKFIYELYVILLEEWVFCVYIW